MSEQRVAPSIRDRSGNGSEPTCHVVTHVHWDREWYRPFESYRARLVELVEQVCTQLDAGSIERFHLDGQTITLRDVGDLRPDLVERVRRHVRAGVLTVGPWHVLADNQLVSGENLIRNLLAARRLGAGIGALTAIGYSPDAFGHPADLPRILTGFGIDTALVWRGAPPEASEFRWRSPDGAEVYAVNQAYHEAEILWTPEGRAERLTAFLDRERERRPEGPWLLMNGGDHLAPRAVGPVLAAVAASETSGGSLVQSSLEDFFDDLRATRPDPVVIDGELRFLGGPGSFLLPGTLSSRIHLKQENSRAERMLERIVEPLLAAEVLDPPAVPGLSAVDATPIAGPTDAQLRHAWELVLENAPHDSICGCSVDEVHRENSVRTDRVLELGDQMLRRALLRRRVDTRVHGTPADDAVRIAVHVPFAAGDRRVPVEVDVVVAPGSDIAQLTDPSGRVVPIEVEDIGVRHSFEADLDFLPDSVEARVLRLRFIASVVEPGAVVIFTAELAPHDGRPRARADSEPGHVGEAVSLPDGRSVIVLADAAFDVVDPATGTRHRRLGRLVDEGDRGDTYTYDPPAGDRRVDARAGSVAVIRSAVRTVISWRAELDIPHSLDETREARSTATIPTAVDIRLTAWHGSDTLEWTAEWVNASRDHRLRLLAPVAGQPTAWTSGQHFSSLTRPFGPVIGPAPQERNRESAIGTHPAHGYVAAGGGDEAIGILLDHVSEVQGIAGGDRAPAEVAVTVLRSVGWLSRFDLRTRTTGAGPELATPEAQLLRPITARVAFVLGAAATDAYALAERADARRVGVVALQVRVGPEAPSVLASPLSVSGALVTAFKPAEDGRGAILRLSNPTDTHRHATLHAAVDVDVSAVRMDETALAGASVRVARAQRSEYPLAPQQTLTLRLVPAAPLPGRPTTGGDLK
ncbi:hypothetical protein [Microbacterium sp. ABRD28]|uniref:glycoside hydrolase family 38 N-terminal domain-containing protein n=1 Tax=Microbacterium sp. ABRD28 TaxID=2268461 RepID=UPI0013DDBC66|nr:hypothetical protein [Microbacterium sp. ABRD28]